MSEIMRIRVQVLTPEAYAPFGWVLGAGFGPHNEEFVESDASAFSHEHTFDPGEGGVPEVLWVNYIRKGQRLRHLESHLLTEQALVPVRGDPIVHVVCPPSKELTEADYHPDIANLKTFILDGTQGVCMRRGCWHGVFPLVDRAVYVMLTRRSTTLDLIRARRNRTPPTETVIRALSDITDSNFEFII